jgi:hypothetical protein
MAFQPEDLSVRPIQRSSPAPIPRLFGDAELVRSSFVGGSVGC